VSFGDSLTPEAFLPIEVATPRLFWSQERLKNRQAEGELHNLRFQGRWYGRTHEASTLEST